MTKQQLFTIAHKKARKLVKKTGNYMIAFSFALKSIYRTEKLRNNFYPVLNKLEEVSTSATFKQIKYLASLINGAHVLAEELSIEKLTKASASKLIKEYEGKQSCIVYS